jgi:tetratricopeptide (TPR) repeat protein
MVCLRSMLHRRLLLHVIFAIAGLALAHAEGGDALRLLNQGKVDEAAVLLNSTLADQPHNAQAHQLLCRVYYAQEKGDDAVAQCEQAVRDDSSSSTNQLWLGRAYGQKAEQANLVSAFSTAKKVHVAFERAIELDPANVEAMSDLGQFYVNAPGIVGGGIDRAEQLAPKLMQRSPARGHRLLGQIAVKKNDPTTAESEFKAAVGAAQSPEAWIDLAQFYQQRGQIDQAVAAVQSSVAANHKKNAALVDAASLLIEMKRQPQLAEKCLRDYLASPSKTDDAPAFRAQFQLGNLLKQQGNPDAARQSYNAALAQASKYAPAQKALRGA